MKPSYYYYTYWRKNRDKIITWACYIGGVDGDDETEVVEIKTQRKTGHRIRARRVANTSGSRRRTTTCSSWTAPPDRRSGRKPRRPAPFRRTTAAGGTAGAWRTAPPDRRPGRRGHPRPRRCWPRRQKSRNSAIAARSRRRPARAAMTWPPRGHRRPTSVLFSRPRPAWRTPAWSRRTTPIAPAWAPPGWSVSSSLRPSASATAWTSIADGPWLTLGLPWRLYTMCTRNDV